MATKLKAIEQFFHVVLFIMLCKVALTVESVDETPESELKAIGWYSYAILLVIHTQKTIMKFSNLALFGRLSELTISFHSFTDNLSEVLLIQLSQYLALRRQ